MNDIKCHIQSFRASPKERQFLEHLVALETKSLSEIVWTSLKDRYGYKLWEKSSTT